MTSGVLDRAADVHDQLLKLIAPATPGSIAASSLDPRRNGVLFGICICAAIAFLLLIAPILLSSYSDKPDPMPQALVDLLQIVGGAGLGSAFYALYTASSYIKSGTFDPKYNNTYLIRFGLGLLSGLILAYFLKNFLNITGSQSDINLEKVSVSALAVVGGYAAEAVAQVLTRVSDTLVVLVSGSDKDKIDTAKQQAAADADKKLTQARSDTVTKLQQAMNAADPKAAMSKVVSDLLASK